VVASAFSALWVRVCVASDRKQRQPEAGSAVANAALADCERGCAGALNEKLVSEDERMMKQLQASSYLFGGNAPYVEELYERYLDNPGSVPEKWRAYFDQMQLVPAADGSPDSRDVAHAPIVE
jgi:hypothetical protein